MYKKEVEENERKNEVKITDEMVSVPGAHIIDAPTGMGKSRAVKTITVPTLVVSPRCALVDQQTEETFAEHSNITVRTIQSLAYMDDPVAYLNKFSVVVADEAHDLISASDYDENCTNLVRIILHARVLICLTATDIGLEWLFGVLGRKTIVHKYADNVAETLQGGCFGFIPNIETAIDVIDKKLKKNERVLFFTDNTNDIEMIQKFYLYDKKILPVVSESNPKHNRLCKGRKADIDKLIKEMKFPDGVQVVCATRCMDVGLNIMNPAHSKDPKVTTVICNIYELACLRQCLGRLRLDRKNGEQVDFYAVLPTGQLLSARKRTAEKLLEQFDCYRNDYDKYVADRVEKRENRREIVYVTRNKDGEKVERIDYCKLCYLNYLMATIYKNPTVTAWKILVEQMLGVKGIPMETVEEQQKEVWQYKQTEKLRGMKLTDKQQKSLLISIYEDDLKTPQAFNRLWAERGWDFHVEGDLDGGSIYITDENGKKKRKRNRNAWMVS